MVPGAYYNIAHAYICGRGVDVDKKKAVHYWELAAMKGHASARNNIGVDEANLNNMDRALKHWMIAVGGGYKNSLKRIQELYMKGNATKEDYTAALHAYQEYLNEVKSAQRDEAAAYSEVQIH